MTTYDALEASADSSRPLEIYRFALGSATYAYTSAEDTVTVGGVDYRPIGISRNAITQGVDARRAILNLTVRASNPFAQRYVLTPPGYKATLSVIRLQRDESPTFATQELIYKGSVKFVNFPDAGETAQIAVQTIESSTSRVVPRFSFMGMCNHMLYDVNCGVDPDLFAFSGTVSAVSGNVITLTGAGTSGIDFVGGYCRPNAVTDFRLIISQSGDNLTLLLPFEVNPTGQTVKAYAGCDHLLAGDCALVFDNVRRFGGFAYVPNKNVFTTGVR